MMEEFDFEFEPDWEWEQDLTRSAFENTYNILIGAVTLKELMDRESMQAGSWDQHNTTATLFNPMKKKKDVKMIDNMIAYYTETEEYEKCAKLVKLKKENKW
jgi:hypothetical protein